MALSKEQFTELYQRGLTVDQIVAFEAGQKPQKPTAEGGLPGFATGFTKSLLETGRNIGKFGQEIYQQTGGRVVEALTGLPREQQGSQMFEGETPAALQRRGTAENIGGAVADIASFAVPQARLASSLSKAPLLAQTAVEGVAGFSQAKAQGASTPTAVATGIATSLIPSAGKLLPKILSYTSRVDEGAYNVLLSRRNAQKLTPIFGQAQTNQQALEFAQKAVRDARKSLSQEWGESVPGIIEDFTGRRMKFTGPEKVRITELAKEYGIESVPQNLDAVSVKEAVDFLGKINEVPGGVIATTPKGRQVKQLRDLVKNRAISSFGGKGGSLDTLYSNYTSKKQALDSFNDLVRAYSTGKPRTMKEAENALRLVFKENSNAYLDAVLDFEEKFGVDILSRVASANVRKVGPQASIGQGLFGNRLIDMAINTIALPLTSPRISSTILRALNTVPQAGAALPLVGENLMQ